MKPSITPEVIEALRVLRMHVKFYADISSEFDVLDNAGIFAAIDDATGYDVDPSPDAKPQVSRCTCPATTLRRGFGHLDACPGDPAEWSDMAFTTAMAVENMRLTAEHTAKPVMGECKCAKGDLFAEHLMGCPALSPVRRECPADDCTGEFAVNKDGSLRAHSNDTCEPCSQGR